LPTNTQLSSVGAADPLLQSAPPSSKTMLRVKRQLRRVGEEESLSIPAPLRSKGVTHALPSAMVAPSRMAEASRSVPAGWWKTWMQFPLGLPSTSVSPLSLVTWTAWSR
jgi:hypothetical protein